MRKPLLIAIFLGLVAFKAEAQVDYFTVMSVVINSKTPPKDWFGIRREQEIAAALLRVSTHIGKENDVKRRAFASGQIALGLARLGREEEARKLTKSADIQQEITYFTAIRSVLTGRENEAIQLLPKLDKPQRINLQTLLGSAYYMWRSDKTNARKWLIEALNTVSKNRSRSLEVAYLELGIASNLAKIGAIGDAKIAFSDFEAHLKSRKVEGDSALFYRSMLFDARFLGGLETDALAMLENDKSLKPSIIQYFFRIKKDSLALELLNQELPTQGFEIVRDFNRGASEKEGRNLVAYKAMRALWNRLPAIQKNEQNASEMTLAIARYESVREAYNFIGHLESKIASSAQRDLKADILAGVELQKQVAPQILQNWREAGLKGVEAATRKAASQELRNLDGPGDDEADWMLLYYAATHAKNFKKARLALEKCESAAAKGGNLNPGESLFFRYRAWLQLGDRKRANRALLQFKQEAAKSKQHPDSIYYSESALMPPELIRELFQTQPPRDLNIVSQLLSFSVLDEQNKAAIPEWYFKVSDVPTRAVLIANRAKWLQPLETVQIQIN